MISIKVGEIEHRFGKSEATGTWWMIPVVLCDDDMYVKAGESIPFVSKNAMYDYMTVLLAKELRNV